MTNAKSFYLYTIQILEYIYVYIFFIPFKSFVMVLNCSPIDFYPSYITSTTFPKVKL